MFDPSLFTIPKAKPLPVCLLLDISGSMSGEKIRSLNEAVKEMLNTFVQEEKMEHEFLVSVITFGSQVSMHIPPTKASHIEWQDLRADGLTPLGGALQMAKALIEDKERTPSRAYRPTVVLVSDGQPNDNWEDPLESFINHGRSSKCDRMAMAIGSDANKQVLQRFLSGTENRLFYAENAAQLHEFFRRVTMSVTTSARVGGTSKKVHTTSSALNKKSCSNSIETRKESCSEQEKPISEDKHYW